MKRTTKKLLTVAVSAALFTPMAAMATNGYFGHGIGMKSMGMGGAGIAMATVLLSCLAFATTHEGTNRSQRRNLPDLLEEKPGGSAAGDGAAHRFPTT